MIKPDTRRWSPIVLAISVLIIGETATFLLASLLHLGVPIPLGFSEPQNIPATIVEGLCWLFLATSLYALFAHKTWAWWLTVAAHVFAILGVFLGIFATRNSTGDEANFIYHRVILVVLIVTLILLVTPGARAAMGYSKQ